MRRFFWFTLFLLLFAVLAGCQPGAGTTPNTEATIQAMVATQLAQAQPNNTAAPPAPDYAATIAAQSTQIGILQGTLAAPAPTSAPPPTPDDTTALRNALAAFLAWPPSQVEFDIAENTGTFAQGVVKRVGEDFGAMWVAAKIEGVWMIGFVGQGVPECDRINALNIPIQWIDYCMVGDNTVHR